VREFVLCVGGVGVLFACCIMLEKRWACNLLQHCPAAMGRGGSYLLHHVKQALSSSNAARGAEC
jgi:hypothetical protein